MDEDVAPRDNIHNIVLRMEEAAASSSASASKQIHQLTKRHPHIFGDPGAHPNITSAFERIIEKHERFFTSREISRQGIFAYYQAKTHLIDQGKCPEGIQNGLAKIVRSLDTYLAQHPVPEAFAGIEPHGWNLDDLHRGERANLEAILSAYSMRGRLHYALYRNHALSDAYDPERREAREHLDAAYRDLIRVGTEAPDDQYVPHMYALGKVEFELDKHEDAFGTFLQLRDIISDSSPPFNPTYHDPLSPMCDELLKDVKLITTMLMHEFPDSESAIDCILLDQLDLMEEAEECEDLEKGADIQGSVVHEYISLLAKHPTNMRVIAHAMDAAKECGERYYFAKRNDTARPFLTWAFALYSRYIGDQREALVADAVDIPELPAEENPFKDRFEARLERAVLCDKLDSIDREHNEDTGHWMETAHEDLYTVARDSHGRDRYQALMQLGYWASSAGDDIEAVKSYMQALFVADALAKEDPHDDLDTAQLVANALEYTYDVLRWKNQVDFSKDSPNSLGNLGASSGNISDLVASYFGWSDDDEDDGGDTDNLLNPRGYEAPRGFLNEGPISVDSILNERRLPLVWREPGEPRIREPRNL